MPQQEVTFESIFKELKAKKYYPIYYLMGEEPYYIDLISDYIANHVLTETEKEFNQTIVYGADTDIASIINAAKRYPMMSEYQVVIVKEAQALRNLDELSYYLQKPLISTILVICHKHGALDKRKKLAIEIEKKGILFESKRLKEFQLPAFINSYMKRRGVDIESKAISMLAEFVGTDLSRLAGEMESSEESCEIYCVFFSSKESSFTASSVTKLMFQPMSFCARRTFCAFLPNARREFSELTRIVSILRFSSTLIDSSFAGCRAFAAYTLISSS